MSITDELRAWAKEHLSRSSILAIADRIDAEHEESLVSSYLKGVFSDGELAENGFIRLPKDADNVSWNVGDRDEDGNTVTQLRLSSDGWDVIVDNRWLYRPERKRHYHAPTVEDVLTEFGIDWEHESDCEDRAALLKEYAKRLRLVNDEE